MSDFPMMQSYLPTRIKSRSMGLKLIVVGGLALVMTIPAVFVSNLVEDRTNRARDVTREISDHVGGPQTFLGPTLAILTSSPRNRRAMLPSTGCTKFFPHKLRPR